MAENGGMQQQVSEIFSDGRLVNILHYLKIFTLDNLLKFDTLKLFNSFSDEQSKDYWASGWKADDYWTIRRKVNDLQYAFENDTHMAELNMDIGKALTPAGDYFSGLDRRIQSTAKCRYGYLAFGQLLSCKRADLIQHTYKMGEGKINTLINNLTAAGYKFLRVGLTIQETKEAYKGRGETLIEDELSGLIPAVVNILNRNGIFTLSELTSYGVGIYELPRMGIGTKNHDNLESALSQKGISLQATPTDPVTRVIGDITGKYASTVEEAEAIKAHMEEIRAAVGALTLAEEQLQVAREECQRLEAELSAKRDEVNKFLMERKQATL